MFVPFSEHPAEEAGVVITLIDRMGLRQSLTNGHGGDRVGMRGQAAVLQALGLSSLRPPAWGSGVRPEPLDWQVAWACRCL